MPGTRKPELTPTKKNLIAQFCLANNKDGVLIHGKVKEAAEKFNVCKRKVSRIWAAARVQMSTGQPVILTSNKVGIPKKKHVFFDQEKMKKIPLLERSNMRDLACGLIVSKSQVGRWVKFKVIRPHTNAIKPQLADKNKKQRMVYSLGQLECEPGSRSIAFSDMSNVVHIDEKWFYMTRSSERYYMTPKEEEPLRTCQSKRFIPKVMFMCAVARPRFSKEGEVLFDGKIGLWPFIKQEPAQRTSRNRVRGTLVTKPIESITKDVIKDCILNQIIPAIKAKWPLGASKDIFIQQDNTPPHILNDDPEFKVAASADEFNIKLICQPPNSPDTNINDLGFFRAIQSLQNTTSSRTVDQLVMNVMLAYEELSPTTLNKVFLSLQACLIEVLKAKGHNNYKLPHLGKERMIREGTLPTNLKVDLKLILDAVQYMMDSGNTEVWAYDIEPLLAALTS